MNVSLEFILKDGIENIYTHIWYRPNFVLIETASQLMNWSMAIFPPPHFLS